MDESLHHAAGADGLAALLGMEPHPEGGYFRETYRSKEAVSTARGVRAAASVILFLVTVERPSRFHRLASDEAWLFHGGAPLTLTVLQPDGSVESVLLAGPDAFWAEDDATPQALVPGGAWQAAAVTRPHAGAWSLVSCVVTPGFDFADFELGDREALQRAYPEQAELIAALT